MHNFIYINSSEVWFDGMRVSAIHKGRAVDINDSRINGIVDRDWRIDFGGLVGVACSSRKVIPKIARLYGSRPLDNDSILTMGMNGNGFELTVSTPNDMGTCDISCKLAVDVLDDSYCLIDPKVDTVSLVTGNGNCVYAVRSLRKRGIYVRVVFWDHVDYDLKCECDEFISLNGIFDITSRVSQWWNTRKSLYIR